MSGYRNCSDCGSEFLADARWKIRCISCWRRAKEIDPSELDQAYRRGFDAGRAASTAHSTPSVDPVRVRELLQLAHPDKHDNSALSNRATAWLLGLRMEARHARH